MLLEFEVRSCSRCCSATQRTLQPGDVYFSLLEVKGDELLRCDFSVEAWRGAPEGCLGWWRSRIPTKDQSMPQLAPTEVLLNLFMALAQRVEDREFRYLLGLLLLRRRVLRREDVKRDAQGHQVEVLRCPRRDETYELVVAEPDAEHAERLQQRMVELLYGDGEADPDESPNVVD